MPEPGIKKRVLVIGGYGVFGGRLSKQLAKHGDLEIIVAGRAIGCAQAHTDQHGGVPMVIDTSHDLNAIVADIQPTVVIDAAGPF
jgi:saccharopine dehydrogenase-like NADP-dependent oxidoreductase